ncbi:class I SAM-dependent methyltransferase [Haematospirillum sp. 15-248]|uniref:rhodoquinone biosynthesis methyltransferase RquA n=1 Tax=Haematospirillum sp. 15-248 TaxID=2723107 RepID=UPI00143C3D7E|nr:rhodoquinone biosynthesis methyltransferase RquA [Haematospirillum sp. 15-248]NKD86936.1 class I SAM-dependent methyltransferase [Haematospirillum sp. 15-248]
MPDGNGGPVRVAPEANEALVPTYLRETYAWAYLSPFGTRFFDRQAIVNTILWGNASRLCAWACKEIQPGSRIMQPAAVYGNFSRKLADAVGPTGLLDIRDIAPVQVRLTTHKMQDITHAHVYQHDARQPSKKRYDSVVCFFLLHEVPKQDRPSIVRNLLESLTPSGRCIFIDYHRPARWHPLRPVLSAVFHYLEPYASSMVAHEISHICAGMEGWLWKKETCFGGLYQKTIAQRRQLTPQDIMKESAPLDTENEISK